MKTFIAVLFRISDVLAGGLAILCVLMAAMVGPWHGYSYAPPGSIPSLLLAGAALAAVAASLYAIMRRQPWGLVPIVALAGCLPAWSLTTRLGLVSSMLAVFGLPSLVAGAWRMPPPPPVRLASGLREPVPDGPNPVVKRRRPGWMATPVMLVKEFWLTLALAGFCIWACMSPGGGGMAAGLAWLCLIVSLARSVVRADRERSTLVVSIEAARAVVWLAVAGVCCSLHVQYAQRVRARADQIVAATYGYRDRTGDYPPSLEALDPRWDQSQWRPGDAFPRFVYHYPSSGSGYATNGAGRPWLTYRGVDGGYDFCEYRFDRSSWQCGES